MEGEVIHIPESWIQILTLPFMKCLTVGLSFLRHKMGMRYLVGLLEKKVNGTMSVLVVISTC